MSSGRVAVTLEILRMERSRAGFRCAGPFYSEVLDEAQWNYCSPIPIAGLPELPDGIVRM